ncbi:hypothetical protein Y032_0041g355 [Ancylostoma ceylanicum]|uniref:Uncharacterized protein n=1 Tax=Ancylostoma ceylanicum TaxID=53326 RepID=A0A016UHQ2_9BILA|nr:hypothetical protein Y032_0041g355 [Ancylostoma ceylanicum]
MFPEPNTEWTSGFPGHAIWMFPEPNTEWTSGFPYVLITTSLPADKMHNIRDHAIPELPNGHVTQLGVANSRS